MERDIRKCLTFVRRGECRRVKLSSRKLILNFKQTNLESQVKSVGFLLNKPLKWVNRRVKTEPKNWSSSWRVPCYQRWRREQEGDGDYVTKEYVYEMMKIQESLFRHLFDSLFTNVNSRIDGVVKDLAELNSSLQFTQKDVEELNQ